MQGCELQRSEAAEEFGMRCSLSEWITCMSFLELPKRARALSSLSHSLSRAGEPVARLHMCILLMYGCRVLHAGEVVPAATFPWDYGRHQIPEAPLGQEDHAAFSK